MIAEMVIYLTEEEQKDPAVLLAMAIHDGQYRKQLSARGEHIPYIAHSLAVRRLVIESGGSEEEAKAGVLHDVEENAKDQEAAEAAILALHHGETIEAIVAGVSQQRDKSIPWLFRMQAEVNDLLTLPPSCFRVKVCDELANLRDFQETFRRIGKETFAMFQKGHETLTSCKARVMWFHNESIEQFKIWLEQNPNQFPPGCVLRQFVGECEAIALEIGA